jgi:hypothetical protein
MLTAVPAFWTFCQSC